MIISKLQGGLGNQMFQWAYGKSLSLKHNTGFFIDKSFYNNQSGITFRTYELNKFPFIKDYDFINNNKKVLQITDNFHFNQFQYDENFNYYLNGYWQSEKYFTEYSDIIKEELKPSDEILNKLKRIINGKSVSLHIRRTDYLTSNGFHPVQSTEYYSKALEIIGDYDQLLIFSDDINWCKNNLTYKNMIFIENQDNVEDIWLMSLCQHNIIANSSFSWWGAWLNNNENKIIIAPKNWFGQNSKTNDSDIVPENWIKI